MTEPVTTIRCAVCRLSDCDHDDLIFAGLVPARGSNTRFTTPGEAKAQGGSNPPAGPSCVTPDHRFHTVEVR